MVNKCKYCGESLREGQNFCLACGRMQRSQPIQTETPGKRRGLPRLLSVAAPVLAALALAALFLGGSLALPPRDAVTPPAGTTEQTAASVMAITPKEAEQTGVTAPAVPAGTEETDHKAIKPIVPLTEPENEQTEPEDGQTEQGVAAEPTDEPEPAPEPQPAPEPAVQQPTVTAQPAHQAVVVNDTARFSVKAEGSGLSYQWQYSSPGEESSEPGEEWRDIPTSAEGCGGVNGPELTVKATVARNGYFYRCAVTNGGGTVYSQAANLYSCAYQTDGGLYWTVVERGAYRVLAFAGSGAMPDYGDGESPWQSDTKLERVILGSGVTGIGDYAFWCCYRLREATLPDTLTTIGDYAFYNCERLSSVTIPAAVSHIGEEAFFACGSLAAIRVKGGNKSFCSVDGVLYNRSKTELILYPHARQGSFTVPEGVKTVSAFAFYNCPGLTEVKLPESLTAIEDSAFNHCTSLSAVTIPDSVERIGDGAFGGCTRLSAVTLGSGVKEIGSYAFGGDYRITDVYYNGTQKGWDAIDISYSNDYLLNATLHLQ